MFHGLSIEEYIKKHKNYDSDFWEVGIGRDYIITLLYRYTDNEWNKLYDEVNNWEDESKEILILVLTHKNSFSQTRDKISLHRSRLFAQIFDSVDVNFAYDFLDELPGLLEFSNLDIDSLHVILNKLKSIKESVIDDHTQVKSVLKIEEKLKDNIEITEKK